MDAGVAIPHGEDVFPSADRLAGKHLGEARAKAIADVRAKMEATP